MERDGGTVTNRVKAPIDSDDLQPQKRKIFKKKKRSMPMEHGTRLDADESMTGTNTQRSRFRFTACSYFYAIEILSFALRSGGGGRSGIFLRVSSGNSVEGNVRYSSERRAGLLSPFLISMLVLGKGLIFWVGGWVGGRTERYIYTSCLERGGRAESCR